jgi:hypothetical protein
MKFLKQKNISKFSISDQTLFANQYGRAVMNLTGGLRLPKGTENQRPQLDDVRTLGGAEGFIRYNTDTKTIEAYVDGVWEVVRAPGAATITKQTLGPGDGIEMIFGPLLSQFEYKYTASLDNLIVLVENVIQISGTNTTLIQNPCLVTGSVISFSGSVMTSSNTSEVNFRTKGFFIGQEIAISNSASNNGTYTVLDVAANGSTITVEESFETELEGTAITVTGISPLTSQPYESGFYLKFDDADIVDKYVTVYYGYAN